MYNIFWNNQALQYLVIYPFPACFESCLLSGCPSNENDPGCISLERTQWSLNGIGSLPYHESTWP